MQAQRLCRAGILHPQKLTISEMLVRNDDCSKCRGSGCKILIKQSIKHTCPALCWMWPEIEA